MVFSRVTYHHYSFFFFFFNDPATTEIYTLSLHDALPIFTVVCGKEPGPWFTCPFRVCAVTALGCRKIRSEEHTSELQSRLHLVCRLLLEKKKQKIIENCFNAY